MFKYCAHLISYLHLFQQSYKLVIGLDPEEDMIKYFMEDPFYKNHVMEYYDDAMKLKLATSDYAEQAQVVVSKITELENSWLR